MRTLFLTGVVSVLATGCSFTAAGGLDECTTSADCGQDKVCTQGLCLPLPEGCGTRYGSQDANAIQFGALFPIRLTTQPGAGVDVSDEQASNAARLALEQINQRNFKGRQFALQFCDTANDVERAKRQAEWLVKEKKVPALITAGSSQTLAVAQSVAIPNNVLVMSYSASSPELTTLPDKNGGAVGLLWRTAASDAIQGRVIAQLPRSDARFGNPKRVGIVYVNDPYGSGLYETLSTALSAGASPILNEGYRYERRGDVRDTISRLNTFDPDLTVLIAFADDATNILKEAATRPNLRRAPDGNHRWFFSDSVKDVALLSDSTAAAQARDFYGTAPAQGAGSAFRSFESAFVSAYSKNPSEYAYTSNAYDAAYLLALSAIYSQGTTESVTGTRMAEGLTKMSTGTSGTTTQLTSSNFIPLAAELDAGRSVNVEGASGRLDFNDAGEAPAPVELWQVSGSTFVTVTSAIEPTP